MVPAVTGAELVVGGSAIVLVSMVLAKAWAGPRGSCAGAGLVGRHRAGDGGRIQGPRPHPGDGWLVRPDRGDADSWVGERMISQALAHLGIAPLDRFFKNGAGQLVYTVPARVGGNGAYAQARLPMGVTAGMVADRRERLATNLGTGGAGDLAHRGRQGRGCWTCRWPTRACEHQRGVVILDLDERAGSLPSPGSADSDRSRSGQWTRPGLARG